MQAASNLRALSWPIGHLTLQTTRWLQYLEWQARAPTEQPVLYPVPSSAYVPRSHRKPPQPPWTPLLLCQRSGWLLRAGYWTRPPTPAGVPGRRFLNAEYQLPWKTWWPTPEAAQDKQLL
mmetsp:Transcript_12694/g.35091  ORF Transcript_12694/g.35091 Transcript_12694/m.35091 type:complete len:120 (-) Transcript_12694:933-1292(-)